MDIQHLKIFISVYKNRGFSKAAVELHLSQPTISEHIKNLEFELGCKLFDRVGRTIIPTREAGIIYPKALQIIEDLEKLREELSHAGSNIKGQLILGASTIPGTYILPVMASEFKKLYPEVSFEIIIEDSRKITDMVLNYDLILGAVGAEMEPGKINYLPFIEDELILAAGEKVIPKNTISVKGLKDVPFILREEGSGTLKTMERFLNKKGIDIGELNVVAVLGSTDSVKQAIKSGLGASILSRIAIKDELTCGALKEIRIRGLKMKRSFYLITHKKRALPNPYNAFYNYLKDSKR
ncbi:HTH-type transcriptional regulator CysL [bacterium BMS3Bbin08]|nr:HTH-type transcriptional regulator CysL [bacterium BMS3Bbin08]